MWKRETVYITLPYLIERGNSPQALSPANIYYFYEVVVIIKIKKIMAQSTANPKPTKRRVYYMYYWYNKKRHRSAEYPSLKAFYEKCGEWCDEHPFDWELCHRDLYEVVQ